MRGQNDGHSLYRSRRRLLTGLGAGTLGLAGTALLPRVAQAQSGDLDINILNFALNLEYLEAQYYTFATTGRGIASFGIGSDGRGRGGRVIIKSNPKVPFVTPLIEQYAEEIAQDERDHVEFLRAALGSQKVAQPRLDLVHSFDAAAQAAGLGASFDPFANEINFLLGAFIFEDVGVTAYKGAARFLSNKDYLEAAAGILGAEAYHASEIRTVLAARATADPGLGIVEAVEAISDLRDAADGPIDDDQPIFMKGAVNIVPTDDNGLVFSRTTQQVLNIVYLDPDGNPGGFFPNGLNGAIR